MKVRRRHSRNWYSDVIELTAWLTFVGIPKEQKLGALGEKS